MRRKRKFQTYDRPSQEQFRLMLDFMELHGDISKYKPGIEERLKRDRLWKQLVTILHSVGECGTEREVKEWRKVWSDWKIKTKRKLALCPKIPYQYPADYDLKSSNPLGNRFLRLMENHVLDRDGIINEADFPRAMAPMNDIPAWTRFASTSTYMPTTSNSVETQEVITPTLPVIVAEASTSQATNNPSISKDVTSPSAAITPSRERAHERRRRRRQTELEGPELVQLKRHWLRLKKHRLRKEHEREMARLRLEQQRLEREHDRDVEKLRVEALRVDMENRRTEMFEKISNIGNEMLGLLAVISQRVRN